MVVSFLPIALSVCAAFISVILLSHDGQQLIDIWHGYKGDKTLESFVEEKNLTALLPEAVVPLKRDGVVILITDGAKGVAREVALELSGTKYGFHVLVGVKSEAEAKSFTYEAKKGLEPIIFDISGAYCTLT